MSVCDELKLAVWESLRLIDALALIEVLTESETVVVSGTDKECVPLTVDVDDMENEREAAVDADTLKLCDGEVVVDAERRADNEDVLVTLPTVDILVLKVKDAVGDRDNVGDAVYVDEVVIVGVTVGEVVAVSLNDCDTLCETVAERVLENVALGVSLADFVAESVFVHVMDEHKPDKLSLPLAVLVVVQLADCDAVIDTLVVAVDVNEALAELVSLPLPLKLVDVVLDVLFEIEKVTVAVCNSVAEGDKLSDKLHVPVKLTLVETDALPDAVRLAVDDCVGESESDIDAVSDRIGDSVADATLVTLWECCAVCETLPDSLSLNCVLNEIEYEALLLTAFVADVDALLDRVLLTLCVVVKECDSEALGDSDKL